MLTILKKQWFLFGIFAAFFLGALLPHAAKLNQNGLATTFAVCIIFFNTGLLLPSESILKGILNYRVHLFSQIYIFIINPLLFFLFVYIFENSLSEMLIIGIFGLAVLPTTISSCTVLTQSSNGDVSATMFNASLSNLLGILLSPLLLSFLLNTTNQSSPIDLGTVMFSLSTKMIIPVFFGQVLRRFIKAWVKTRKVYFSNCNNFLILSIIFFSFAKTAPQDGLYSSLSPLPFILLGILHIVILALVYVNARFFKFQRGSLISVMYVAPQKTLAMGLPLLSTFFVNDNTVSLSIILLPLIFYHAWQLIVAAIIQSNFTKQ